MKQLSKEELKELSKQELCDYCRANHIKGYSGKNKAQRVDLILEHYSNVSTKQAKESYEKTTIMDEMVKIQEKHGNDPKKFQKDPEFVKLSQSLGRTRKTKIKLQTVKEVKKQLNFNNFNDFFNWFKYNLGKDLKLSYVNDYRKNEDFDTGEEYIEVFMDSDFNNVIKGLRNVPNLRIVKKRNYRIYLGKPKTKEKQVKKQVEKAKKSTCMITRCENEANWVRIDNPERLLCQKHYNIRLDLEGYASVRGYGRIVYKKAPETLVVRRQSIPSESKKSKDWKFYVKVGKEKVHIASQGGIKDLVRLEGDKTMLRTHMKWRYSIYYDINGIYRALNVQGGLTHKDVRPEFGYYVSGLTDEIVDKMNELAKKTGSKNRFKLAERKKEIKKDGK